MRREVPGASVGAECLAPVPQRRASTVPEQGVAQDGSVSRLADSVDAAFSTAGQMLSARPGYVERTAQREMALRIAQCIEARTTLVAEAGTGTGKTFAYLVPPLLAGVRTLISTGTRPLQDQLVERDLPAVAQALGLARDVAILKGRANYVCRYHLERNLREMRFERRDDAAMLHRIARFAAQTTTGDRAHAETIPEDAPAWAWAVSTRENCLGQDCPFYDDCFLMKARRRAMQADVVVVNHHLFCADLVLRDEGVSELLPLAQALIFDEAHQLPEVASQFFGVAVSSHQLIEFARDLQRIGRADAPDAHDWIAQAGLIEAAVRELRLHAGRPARLDDRQLRAMGDLHESIRHAASVIDKARPALVEAASRSRDLGRLAERASELAGRLQAWLDALLADTSAPAADSGGKGDTASEDALRPGRLGGLVLWADIRRQTTILHSSPLSVAEPFQRQRQLGSRAWVFVSATLGVDGSFEHFQHALGLEDAVTHCWPSPFDYARNTRLLVPQRIAEPAAAGFAVELADVIAPLLRANRGRAFILCASLRMVARMAELLPERLDPESELLVQGSAPRAVLVERFRHARAPVLVGSASFRQGVDVPGAQLSLVVIDKLPFAPPDDPIMRARADAVRAAGGEPFRDLQLPVAAMALKQAAGRLIRSEADRGVLVIGDRRLVTRSYGKMLLRSLPAFTLTHCADEALQFIEASAALARPG